MTPPAQRMRIADLPRVLLELGSPASRPNSAAVRSWCKSWSGGGIALIVLCLAVYLPGLWSIPPVDRDESRFAQASRTMLESGDYIVPRIGTTPRLNKPPLIYWLQAASARLFGDAPGEDGMGQWGNGNIWVFRVPSVLCAIGTILLTWRLGLRMFDPRAAALAAALLAVCPMIIWDAHQARADQLLLFTTTATMFALYVCWKRAISSGGATEGNTQGVARAARPPVSAVLALWIFIGLGVLAKGPITPMIAVLTAIALSIAARNARWLLKLRPLLGLLIIAALVGPWVYAIVHRVGWETYWTTIKDETLGRSLKDKEGHWGPPGYHLVLLAALFWPGSLLTAAAFINAIKKVLGFKPQSLGLQPRRGTSGLPWASAHGKPAPASQAPEGRQWFPPLQSNRPELFLLAWIIPAWFAFECIATKLPHYTMPLYPAIALLTARTLLAALAPPTTGPRPTTNRAGILIWAIIGLVLLGAGPFVLAKKGDSIGLTSLTAIIAAALTVAIGIGLVLAAASAAGKQLLLRAHTLAILAAALCSFGILSWILPGTRIYWTSNRIAHVLASHSLISAPIALVGFQEDSAIFLTRGRADRVQPANLAAWMQAHPNGVVAVDTMHDKPSADLASITLENRGTVRGYNYANGQDVRVEVYAPRPNP
jgi:4-amino-4-deoxy-L-arabinose transferase-like glycosyltransferase